MFSKILSKCSENINKIRYGDFIWFSEDVGKESLTYFKIMAEYIIRESEREKEGYAQESIDEIKNRILKAAGNLIKAEIREQIYINEYYPSIDDIAAKKLNTK